MYIFPQAAISSVKDVDYLNNEKLLEWMFKPEIRETIQVLSRCYADFYKGSVFFDPAVEPDFLGDSVRLRRIEQVADLFINEPTVANRTEMATGLGPGSRIAARLYFFLFGLLDFDALNRARDIEREEKIGLICQGKHIRAHSLPDQARVVDIMAKLLCHDEVFIFRPHKLRNNLEHVAKIRNAMNLGEPSYRGLPYDIECCSFIVYMKYEWDSFCLLYIK
jgi:hypothetical protein